MQNKAPEMIHRNTSSQIRFLFHFVDLSLKQ